MNPSLSQCLLRGLGKTVAHWGVRVFLISSALLPISVLRAQTCVVTTTADGGAGSFRDCINNGATTVIEFNITDPGTEHTITITGGELGLNYPIFIDGPNGDGDEIIFDGVNGTTNFMSMGYFGTGVPGPGGSVIEGISVINFENGFTIGPFNSDGLTFRDLYIGVDQAGNVGPNTANGIIANGLATVNGQTGIANMTIQNSVISGNDENGIQLIDVEGGEISGNTIGPAPGGNTCVTTGRTNEIGGAGGNGYDGIQLQEGSNDFLIFQNVLSCNGHGAGPTSNFGKRGIYIEGSSNNRIFDNKIGTDISGNSALPNYKSGVLIALGSTNNVVGGTGDSTNIISGNGLTVPAYAGVLDKHGVVIDDGGSVPSNNNRVSNNRIGLAENGLPLGNALNGVEVIGSSEFNVIGGPTAGHGNVISDNGQDGISIALGSSNNTIQHNFIGTDVNGGNSLGSSTGNGNIGIILSSGTGAAATPIANNQILNNTIGLNLYGIQTFGDEEIDNVVIQGNNIGVDVNGDPDNLGNLNDGILFQTDLNDILIGGTGPGEENVISGNVGHGINLVAASATGSNNLIVGNIIGLDANGESVAGSGNSLSGINIAGNTSNVTIGGDTDDDRNLISGNDRNGIIIGGNDVDGIDVFGNYIGLDVNGDDAGNGIDGIQIYGGNNIQVGSGNAGEGNVIGFNDQHGISISGGDAIDVLGNNIGIGLDDTPMGNGFHGVGIANATDVQLGEAGASNIISFNGTEPNGQQVNVFNVTGAGNLTIQSNFVGTNNAGDAAALVSAINNGINITNSSEVLVGGPNVEDGNLASGNIEGINLYETINSTVQNNLVGLNAAGSGPIPNSNIGINISNNSSGNTIGGDSAPGLGNYVAGNVNHGIYVHPSAEQNNFLGNSLGLDTTGVGDIPNGSTNMLIEGDQNTVGGETATNASNYFGGSTDTHIRLSASAQFNEIFGNYIGLDETGAVSNATFNGILVQGDNNLIGSTDNGNVIYHEDGGSIYITGDGNFVDANLIGVEADGTTVISGGNGLDIGIEVDGGSTNQIGVNEGNIIAATNNQGILVDQATNTAISNNFIGVAADESIPTGFGIGGNGIELISPDGATISGNVIGSIGNTADGIQITSANSGTGAIDIQTNFIGVSSSGGNLGNTGHGIQITNSELEDITIGGAGPGLGNTIGFNALNGIDVNNSDDVSIFGNFIGTDAASSTNNLGNVGFGVYFYNGSTDNQVAFDNIIAYNEVGIGADGSTTNGNLFQENSWYCNDERDLGGIILSGGANSPFTNRMDTMVAFVLLEDGVNSRIQVQDIPAGATVDVYLTDTECDNCRQGETHVLTMSDGDSDGIVNQSLGTILPDTSACNDYTFTVTTADGTSEFSTCSVCPCEAPLPEFSPDPGDTTLVCLEGGDRTLGANDPGDADFYWFNAETGAFLNLPVNTTEITVTQPLVADTLSFFFLITAEGDSSCALQSETRTFIYLDPPTAFAGLDDSVCWSSDYELLAASATFDSTYQWNILSGNGGFFDDTELNATYDDDPSDEGTLVELELVVTGFNECDVARDTVELYYAQTPTLDIGSIDDICASTGTVLRVTYTGDTTNLRWAHSGAGDLDTTNKAEPTYTSSPANAGNTISITATVDGIAGCPGDTDTETFDVSPSPTIDAGTADPICYTENGVVDLSAIATPPVSAGNVGITWSLNGGSGSYNGTENDDEPVYTLGTTDSNSTFWLVAEVEGPTSGDCQFVRDSVELTVNGDLAVEAGQPFEVCQLNSVNLDTASVLRADTANAQSFSWAISPLGSGAFDDATAIRPVFTPDPAFTGTVTLTLSAVALPGCTDDDDATTIEVDGQPTLAMAAEAEICSSDGFYNLDDATVAVTNEGTRSWITSGAGGFDDDTDVDPIYTIGATDIGDTIDLTLTVTSANGICASVDSTLRLAVSEELVLDPLSDLGPICEVASISSGTVTGTFTTLYWSTDGGGAFTEGVNEATYNSVVGDAPSVTITVRTDTVGSCASQSEQFDITINGSPNPVITGDLTVCEQTTSSYGVTAFDVLNNYTWQAIGGAVAPASGNPTDVTFDGSETTAQVIVTETDPALCSNSDTLDVKVDLLPTITLADPDVVCDDDPVVVSIADTTNAGGTPTYRWEVNQVNDPLNNSDAFSSVGLSEGDWITVVMTANTSCDTPVRDSVQASVQATPSPEIINPGPICDGDIVLINAVDNNAVSGTLTYSWTGPSGFTSTGSEPFISEAGQYNLTMGISGTTCEGTDVETLEVIVPTVSVTPSSTTILQGASVTLTANAGDENNPTPTSITYSWSPETGDGVSISVAPLVDQTYTVQATIDGCLAEANAFVAVVRPIDPPDVITPPLSGTDGDGDNDTWILDGIETHPNATIKVFNRWGDVVYNGKGGDDYILDPFDGTRNGNDLPLATYWYVIENLEYPEGVTFPDKLNGSVTIIR